MIQLIIAIILGILSGILPGFHINTVALLLSYYSADLIPLSLGIYIPLSIIPLILISGADESSITSLFVIKRLKKEGALGKAFYTSVISSLIGGCIALSLYIIIPNALESFYLIIKDWVYYIVLILSSLVILKSKNKKYFFLIFILSGIIGYLSFISLKEEKFFPMFLGFFALNSLYNNKTIDKIEVKRYELKNFFVMGVLGAILGFFSILLPGISSPSIMGGIIASSMNIEAIQYISMSQAFISSQAFYSFIAYKELGKARIGAINYSKGGDYMLFFIGLVMGSILSFYLIDYVRKIINLTGPKLIGLLLLVLCFYFEGFYGILISLIGYLTARIRSSYEVSASSHMGAIILPVLYFNFFRVF